MSLERRVAKLEAAVSPPAQTGALAEAAQFMTHLWGEDWPAVLDQYTTAGCTPGGDACWACEVLRWFAYRPPGPNQTPTSAETGARHWLTALSKGPREPEKHYPMMSPFFGKDIGYEWKRLHGMGGAPG